MQAVITGVAVGGIMVAVNAAVSAIAKAKKKGRDETLSLAENTRRIQALEKQARETKELAKLTLSTCIIIGDGMAQSGINGAFKNAFAKKKQDALKML
ncbi:MAG: hypothetical protein WDA65_06090 [Christensenellales bacterium]